ncbi:MAG: hypothetical protein EZS28_009373 [Streblomastix strix]|uniref:DNA-directed DNA polymerase n=1 Tax=Streblomastix strix TaxID=222440 RepID=A0A5J4WKG3_9EUKA|nr:MAG: hypothetical protein EZS28_009373 [Streblomastix strix]
MTITDQEVYDSLCNDMVGVNSFVIHRENIAGKTQIHKFVKRDSNIISYGLPHIIDKIICLDFNSFYGSCMNSEQHPLIPYTNHRMYMPGGVKYIIHDYEQAKQFIFNKFRFSSDENIINKHVHLFIAKIKAHIPDEYINEFINFPVIWRNLKIITDKETIREFIYENMIRNNMQHIVEESKLMMLLLTHDQYMQFYNYYLWFLIDRCHLVIDDIKQVIVFAKHCAFNEFVKTNINQRCKAHIEGNKGEELKNKLEANTTFGYDSINTEKYQDFRLCNKKNVWKHHMSNTFLTDKQISENCFIVELEKKRCQCSTPLQVAYFTMDNSKYFYLNAFYNFLTPCLDMNYIHVIYGNIDSLCLAIAHESWPVKDKQLWDKFYPHLFPASNDYNDKKKILGWNIESEATTCLALVPKCYYMENQRDITSGNSNNMNQNAIMKLNGVKQEQNSQINKKQFQDNIDKNIITKVNNTSLIHKQEILSQVIQERIGISGINTKTIVLRNQACAPYVNGVKADKYFIDESH